VADDEKAPIIIVKKVKKVSGGHHGGAWKVAYADFVTAMMAFFLLLWLLSVTTDEQKLMISAYFSPADPRIAESVSGSGGVLGGTTMADEGALTDNAEPVVDYAITPSGETIDAANKEELDLQEVEDEKLSAEQLRREQERFEQVEDQLRQAIETVPELQEVAQNLLIDMTPEGLRIQIIDQEGKPMFPVASAQPLPEAIKLLKLVSTVIQDMPNMISVRGHTDARPFGIGANYTNWELSADRANASRRVMTTAGLDIKRIENVMGKGAREPLIVEDPFSPKNRRITVMLLKESIAPGLESAKAKEKARQKKAPPEPEIRKREEGIIYFP